MIMSRWVFVFKIGTRSKNGNIRALHHTSNNMKMEFEF